MFGVLKLAVGLLCMMAAVALARPAIDAAELRRLDGAGKRAWAAFRVPETRCGILRNGSDGTRVYNTFEAAILTLDFAGVERRVLPLMLSDKTGEDHILKHKVRTPCVLSVAKSGAEYLIEVTARLNPPGASAMLRVDAEGRLLNLADNAGLFYVIGENSRANRLIDRFDFVRGRLSRFTCRLNETAEECEYQFLNYAERVFSDEIRHQAFWPDANRRIHHDELNKEVTRRISDPLILALHRLIIANESSTISPYQMWDAVLADSGMSFGPHQWDIGINPEAQRLFGELLKLASPAAKPDRYLKSVRRFSTSDLKGFLLQIGDLNSALQSPRGRNLIVINYIHWLETEALPRARASLPFLDPANPSHRAMLLFYVDVDNQYGSEEIKSALRSLISHLASGNAPLPSIRAALDSQLMTTPFAKFYPDKAAARLARTWDTLSTIAP